MQLSTMYIYDTLLTSPDPISMRCNLPLPLPTAENIKDSRWGNTSSLWPRAKLTLRRFWSGRLGEVICVGDGVQPKDYPPGLFSAEELEILRQKKTDRPHNWDYPDKSINTGVPFTLDHLTFPSISTTEVPFYGLDEFECSLVTGCIRRGVSSDPAFDYKQSQREIREDTYPPTDQQWIPRSLTTKQIVLADAIALLPGYIHGPKIEVLGFGEVVLSRICWSTSSYMVCKIRPTCRGEHGQGTALISQHLQDMKQRHVEKNGAMRVRE
ncbi:hypothetical protein F5B21DRAFT_493375 [Xylaria acuta]|nr:hypothetical protein F5B21DRAFT_493375 [Xylaria acuta]